MVTAPSFWMGGGLESRCVGRVYGADGTVRQHHPPTNAMQFKTETGVPSSQIPFQGYICLSYKLSP